MSEAVAPVKKAKAAAKPKKPATHPKYSEMIKAAVTSLKERGGSSRQAILKYIVKNFNVGADEKTVNAHLKLALRAGVTKGTLKQSKGTGASGSFRMGEIKAEKPKKAKKPKAAKPAKKAKTPKKPAKKPTAKKAKSPKKTKAAKPAKPAAKKAKTPKKSAKPAAKTAAKKAKTPKKKPAAKKVAKK